MNIGDHQSFLKAKLANMVPGQEEQIELLRQYLELERQNIYRAIATPENVIPFPGNPKSGPKSALNADA